MAHIYKRRKQFWICYYVHGKKIQKSLATDNERIARDKKRKIEYQLSIGDLQITSRLPLINILEDFCKYLQITRTRKSYKNDISRLRIFFGPICEALKPGPPGGKRKNRQSKKIGDKYAGVHIKAELLENITPETINRFLVDRVQTDGWAPKTSNLMRQVLHKLFAYAIKHHGFRSRDNRYPNPVIGGLKHDELTQKIFYVLHKSSKFNIKHYAQNPEVKFRSKEETDRAFRDILGYRIYRDLQRGLRITAPNLEQCGLLNIEYLSLSELCQEETEWQSLHPALATADKDIRFKAAKTLLDYMRRELAILVEYLNPEFHERLKQRSNQWLKEPWCIDEDENLEKSQVLYPCSRPKQSRPDSVYLSPRGGFGQFLSSASTFPNYIDKLTLDDKQRIIMDLLKALNVAGIVHVIQNSAAEDKIAG
jgi:hypothetical protein